MGHTEKLSSKSPLIHHRVAALTVQAEFISLPDVLRQDTDAVCMACTFEGGEKERLG